MELKLFALLLLEFIALSAAADVTVAETSSKPKAKNIIDDVVELHTDSRLEDNAPLGNLKDVLNRLEQIEAQNNEREKKYQFDLDNLRHQLLLQTERTSSLERQVKHLYKTCSHNRKEQMVETKEMSNGTDTRVKEAAISSHKSLPNQRIRRAENETPVAFFATLSHHLSHLSSHQPITFDNIVTNIGNAYNGHFGSFVAPLPGTYVFSTTLFSHYHTNYHGNFVKNGKVITYMYASGGEAGFDTVSQTVILELVKGDDVCIQNTDADKPVFGSNYSTFSGFLLQENFSSSVIVG